MPAVADFHGVPVPAGAAQQQQQQQQQPRHHQRTKSSVLRSLMGHKRGNSDGSSLPSSTSNPTNLKVDTDMAANSRSYQNALGELPQNQQDQPPRSPTKSPTKSAFTSISLKSLGGKDKSKDKDNKEGSGSPTKSPKKQKSSTNIGSLWRPKSLKNLKQFVTDDDKSSTNKEKDKENRAPPSSATAHTPPIYAQFASGQQLSTSPPQLESTFAGDNPFWKQADTRNHATTEQQHQSQYQQRASPTPSTASTGVEARSSKPRPKSFQYYYAAATGQQSSSNGENNASSSSKDDRSRKRQTWGKGGEVAAVVAALEAQQGATSSNGGSRSKSGTSGTSVASASSMASSASGHNHRQQQQPYIDPKEIDKHLEAMLDRRNIPENQRYKMRCLNDTIKMEFIRQDWAETQQRPCPPNKDEHNNSNEMRSSSASTLESNNSRQQPQQDDENSINSGSNGKSTKKKKQFGLSLGRSGGGASSTNLASATSSSTSPTKSKPPRSTFGRPGLGRHLRSKSTENVFGGSSSTSSGSAGRMSTDMGERPSHVHVSLGSSSGSSFLAKVRGQYGGGGSQQQNQYLQPTPGEFVSYLRKVRQPELVEVGRLHKLRLLLRNETVAWTDDFVRQGGMEEIVDLLYRIMAVEWREEHEDALLHENLLCLKALCTTALAQQYLHSIHSTLFPALLHLIFDPEKKGPSEFTTRNIITSILLTYIECADTRRADPQERVRRAATVLRYLRDPDPKEEEKPLSFVLVMRKERPYRVWNKEIVSVTKEVFWIFLHNLNVVALPPPPPEDAEGRDVSHSHGGSDRKTSSGSASAGGFTGTGSLTQGIAGEDDQSKHYAYMTKHFPRERPPVPAAPYVGGVEWDATNYLASHLDLLNAIIACTGPTAAERNALRGQLRISGFERCLGGSLRLCKEKFYGAVHDGLRRWVAAAVEDGWDVRDVRYGPPPSEKKSPNKSRSASPVKNQAKGGHGGGVGLMEPPPRLEIPIRLSFDINDGPTRGGQLCGSPLATPGHKPHDSGWLS